MESRPSSPAEFDKPKQKKKKTFGRYTRVAGLAALVASGSECVPQNAHTVDNLFESVTRTDAAHALRAFIGDDSTFFRALPYLVREYATPPAADQHPAVIRLVNLDQLPKDFGVSEEQIREIIDAFPQSWRQDTVCDFEFINHPLYFRDGVLTEQPTTGTNGVNNQLQGGVRDSPGEELSPLIFTSTIMAHAQDSTPYERRVNGIFRYLLPHEMAHAISWLNAPHMYPSQRIEFATLFARRVREPGRLHFDEVEQAQASTEGRTHERQMSEYFGFLVGEILSLAPPRNDLHGADWDLAMAVNLSTTSRQAVEESIKDIRLFRRAIEITAPDDTPENFCQRYAETVNRVMHERERALRSDHGS